MQDIQLLPAGESDIPLISRLAEKIWRQHYPGIITQEQISYMLEMMYSSKSLKGQMQKGHRFSLILYAGTTIGFLSVHNETKNDWFLNKFYIDQSLSRKGTGTAAFKSLLNLLNPDKINLTVNRQNYKAINFYFKNGFQIERVADFDIGNGYVMNDFVMVWNRK